MKKKTVTIVLTAAMAAAMLAGCGSSSSSDTAASTAATEAATTAATEAAADETTEAAATDTTEAAATSDSMDPGTGKVYLLNFKPETDEAWQDLAQTYTDETGAEVSYDTYSEVIFRFDLDTGECVKLDNYVAEPVVEDPNGANGVTMGQDGSMQVFNSSTNIQTMAPGADGTIWLFRQTNSYADDGTEGTSISELIQLDAHGTLLRTITPTEEEDADETDSWRYTYINTILSDDKGYVYTYD